MCFEYGLGLAMNLYGSQIVYSMDHIYPRVLFSMHCIALGCPQKILLVEKVVSGDSTMAIDVSTISTGYVYRTRTSEAINQSTLARTVSTSQPEYDYSMYTNLCLTQCSIRVLFQALLRVATVATVLTPR